MGNHQCCPVLCQLFEGFLNDSFTLVVERGCRLVKDQDRRVFKKNTCDRQTLLLTAGQLDASLADVGIIAVRKLHDEFMCIGTLGGVDDFFE